MNERRYGKYVLVLALIAMVISFTPMSIPFLVTFKIIIEGDMLHWIMFYGPILSLLIIALVSFMLSKHIKEKRLNFFAGFISIYAITGSLFWFVMDLFAYLLSISGPIR
jgi:hypothetical protein